MKSAPIHRVIIMKSASPQELLSIDLDKSLMDDSACTCIEAPFQMPPLLLPDVHCFKRISSCRGIVLLIDQLALHQYPCQDLENLRPYFYVWNPSTGVHRKIPLPPSACRLFADPPLYGFWYDRSGDDYVILLTVSSTGEDEVQFLFFSLKANSWQNMAARDYFNIGTKPRVGSFLKGSIHWLVQRQEDVPPNKRNYILAFNFTRRNFFEIELPDNVSFDINICTCDLWVHKGLLSLWILGEESTKIWVMDKYRVQSSWTESTVVPSEDLGIDSRVFIPICSYGGNIIGWDGYQGLVKCNETGEVLESRMYGNKDDDDDDDDDHEMYMLGAGIYRESLLPLPTVNVNDNAN